MASTITKFDTTSKVLMGGVDLLSDTLKLALLTSSYSMNSTHSIWSEMSANEVASGDGYTTGGEIITNPTLTVDSGFCTFDADNVVFTALTKTFRGAVVYAVGTFNTLVNPVLFYILFDDAPADKVIVASDFTVQWSPTGIIQI